VWRGLAAQRGSSAPAAVLLLLAPRSVTTPTVGTLGRMATRPAAALCCLPLRSPLLPILPTHCPDPLSRSHRLPTATPCTVLPGRLPGHAPAPWLCPLSMSQLIVQPSRLLRPRHRHALPGASHSPHRCSSVPLIALMCLALTTSGVCGADLLSLWPPPAESLV
jgi:hypothetical protein